MSGPTPLLNGRRVPGNSYVLPEHKIVYISVTKAASTTLRWMIADLAGEDFERFYRAPAAHQTRLMTIHTRRSVWQHTPQLSQLSAARRAEISRDNGWFIFTAVRDPWTRLWSAWQSKFLVRHGGYLGYRDEKWFPRVPSTPADVLDDWYAFVDAAPWRAHPVLSKDRHFLPQLVSVHPRQINYTRIYDLSELSALFDDIRTHLAAVGKPGELYLPRANENPLPFVPAVLDNGVAAAIERHYARDFRVFGGRWDVERLRASERELTTEAVRAVTYHVQANERIADLSKVARRCLAEQRSARRPVALGAAPPRGKAAARRWLRRLAGRLRRRLLARRRRLLAWRRRQLARRRLS